VTWSTRRPVPKRVNSSKADADDVTLIDRVELEAAWTSDWTARPLQNRRDLTDSPGAPEESAAVFLPSTNASVYGCRPQRKYTHAGSIGLLGPFLRQEV
jgi:hypothetical protein